jgi:hypothetical protein
VQPTGNEAFLGVMAVSDFANKHAYATIVAALLNFQE